MTDEARQWLEELSKKLAEENYKIIYACPKPKGNKKVDLSNNLTYAFLEEFLEILVMTALTQYDKQLPYDKEDHYNQVLDRLAAVKFNIQNTVSNAFEASFAKVYGKYVDYYCTIQPVPDPVNEKPC